MATVTVRGLDDEVRRRLRMRAAANDRSMEAEVRAILAEAVSGGPHGPPAAAVPPQPPLQDGPSLSAREKKVAELVADGLTNRQIAAALYLSQRTVESHVSSILRKLGCSRRATVASWVTARTGAGGGPALVLPRMPTARDEH
jgi:DNA-binding NarL/FixJ family response regulator